MTDVAQVGPQLPQVGGPEPTQPQPTPEQGSQPRARPVKLLTGASYSAATTVSLFGEEGSGKTLFGATAPSPLFLDFEGGTSALLDWPELLERCMIYSGMTWDALPTVIEMLVKKASEIRDRRTIVVDTLDAMQSSNIEVMLRSQSNKYLAMEHHYKQSAEQIRRFFVDLKKLGLNIVILSHAQERVIESTGQRFITPAATPKLVTVLRREFDIHGFLYIAEHDWEKPFSNALQTRGNDMLQLKSRFRNLPPLIRNPTFQHILDARQNRKAQS